LSIDNQFASALPYYHLTFQCAENGILKKKSNWLFDTLKIMVGELKQEEVMPGARCTAHPTIKIADVE
jgi:hypothetical protein